jgi:hypothetical protein
MKFDINNYKGKYVMHCKTEEESRVFCNYLRSVGRKWYNGDDYLDSANYNYYKDKTAYKFNKGDFDSVNYCSSVGYTVLEFSDFDWEFTKADLKTGDVVLRRNGEIEIVNYELGTLICKEGGYNLLSYFRNDLTHTTTREWDIIEVRRPKEKCDCCFDAMSVPRRGTLVYERKEPEEMTLAEVCKLLGKEIKIIP